MKVFIAASYSSKVNYDTGEVFAEYRDWLEIQISVLESDGHEVFCALKADNYKINNADPAAAYRLDVDEIEKADAVLAYLGDKPSAGVQTEIGYALAKGKRVILAVPDGVELAWFNQALEKAGVVEVVTDRLAAGAV